MKRILCLSLMLALLLLVGCGNNQKRQAAGGNQAQNVSDVIAQNTTTAAVPMKDAAAFHAAPLYADSAVQVDLTKLNSTMVYSEVNNMMNTPSDYKNKVVRMGGTFATSEYEGKRYYACLIKDATACCAQGIEFLIDSSYVYPADYPEEGQEIVVTGIFDIYYEGDSMYCQLHDACMSNPA
ncbi:MAG: hypothetical protein IJK64_02540 [Clostridia bacterium]|nr:hypothetical protein [Clostridia bacterium]